MSRRGGRARSGRSSTCGDLGRGRRRRFGAATSPASWWTSARASPASRPGTRSWGRWWSVASGSRRGIWWASRGWDGPAASAGIASRAARTCASGRSSPATPATGATRSWRGATEGSAFRCLRATAQPRPHRRHHLLGGLALRGPQQDDVLGATPRSLGGPADALAQLGQALLHGGAHAPLRQPARSSSSRVSSSGRPTTLLSLPSTPLPKRRPSPCTA